MNQSDSKGPMYHCDQKKRVNEKSWWFTFLLILQYLNCIFAYLHRKFQNEHKILDFLFTHRILYLFILFLSWGWLTKYKPKLMVTKKKLYPLKIKPRQLRWQSGCLVIFFNRVLISNPSQEGFSLIEKNNLSK